MSLGPLRSGSNFSVFPPPQPRPRPGALSMPAAPKRPPRHAGGRRRLCVRALSSSPPLFAGPRGWGGVPAPLPSLSLWFPRNMYVPYVHLAL